MKSDDLLKRDFRSDIPLAKCITDITEIPASNGKLYVSAIFDCFDLSVLGLAMETNMKADLCIHTLENALTAYPALKALSSTVTAGHSIPVSPTVRPSGRIISIKA